MDSTKLDRVYAVICVNDNGHQVLLCVYADFKTAFDHCDFYNECDNKPWHAFAIPFLVQHPEPKEDSDG